MIAQICGNLEVPLLRKLLHPFTWPKYDSGTQILPEQGRWKIIVQGGAHYPYVKRQDILMISDG